MVSYARSPDANRLPLSTRSRTIAPLGEFAAAAGGLGLAIFVLLALTPGLGLGPKAAACLFFTGTAALAARALQRDYPYDHLGLCNVVTLARLALTMALVAPLASGGGTSWFVFVVATVALTLDGVDGWFARRQGYASEFGARFDMEVDSLLAFILALNAALAGGAGTAAIVLGLPRYIFVAAAWAAPWMRRNVPERFSRKVVCVAQLGALIALQAPILPGGIAQALVPAVAALLVWSFARDVAWLWRRRA